MTNLQCIILQISGCRADSINKKNPDKNSIGWQAYQEILKKFLHKKIQVRLCQKFSNNNDGPHRFIGCVIGAPDLAFQKLISTRKSLQGIKNLECGLLLKMRM